MLYVPAVTLHRSKMGLRPRALAFYRCHACLVGIVSVLLIGCAKKNDALSPETALSFVPKKESEAPPEPTAEVPEFEQKGTLLAEVPPGSFGPHLVRGAGGWVAVWETAEGSAEGWYSVFWPDGSEPRAPLRLLPSSKNVRLVQAASSPAGEVSVLFHSRAKNKGRLELLRLGSQGELLTAPRLVAESPASILWIRAVPTQGGTLCVWAEQAGAAAQLYAAGVTRDGVSRAVKVVDHVHSWQLAEHEGSVALVTLEGAGQRSVRLRLVGERGELIKAPLTLSQGAVDGGMDLDVVLTDQRIVAAWTERRGLETRLVGSLLDARGQIRKRAVELTVPRGNQALARLVADPDNDQIVMVWDETDRSGGPNRQGASNELLLGRLEGDGPARVKSRLLIESRDALLPQFALRGKGLAALVQLTRCDQEGKKCGSVRSAFLSPDGKSATGAMDLRSIGSAAGPSMLWDLDCSADRCVALAADSVSPTRVFAVELEEGGTMPSPLRPHDESVRLESFGAMLSVPELSAQSGGKNPAGREVVAWLSYFDPNAPVVPATRPAPDGRMAPVRARLQTVSTKKKAEERPSLVEQVISYRARSLGGVAVVAPRGRGLLAWAALDAADPQLFATLIDDAGAKLKQKMLTKTEGEVTDVAAARIEGGYLIAWVDTHGQKPEVWALTVDEQLQSAGPVQVSSGAQSPSGITLLADSGGVIAVWSDARGTPDGVSGDLFFTRLDQKTARPLEPERRLVSTLSHCHTPRLVRRGEGPLVLTWIESRSGKADATARFEDVAAGKLMWASWDGEAARLEGRPAPGLAGAAAFSSHCRQERCGALVTAHGRDGGTELWFSTYDGEGAVTAHFLESLRSPSPLAAAPLLLDEVGFIAERSRGGGEADEDWLLSRLTIEW